MYHAWHELSRLLISCLTIGTLRPNQFMTNLPVTAIRS